MNVYKKDTKVRAIETVGDVNSGDTGVVRAAWLRANIAVLWDKDGQLRTIHRKRLEIV